MKQVVFYALYYFWRMVGSMANSLYHFAQQNAHSAHLKRGGYRGRHARKPLTALWNALGWSFDKVVSFILR